MCIINTDRGFTLIEGIVAATITAVLAMVLFTILRMNNDGVSRGAVNATIQMQYETVLERIGYYTRKAAAILDGSNSSETWTAYDTGSINFTSKRTNCIVMYDTAGNIIKGYKFESSTVKESSDGTNYTLFTVGSSAVQAIGTYAFALSKDRQQDTVLLQVVSSFLTQKDTTAQRQERFRCRSKRPTS
jgi:prepilin-type N-terminal cleavage/methylation domain-containing protein